LTSLPKSWRTLGVVACAALTGCGIGGSPAATRVVSAAPGSVISATPDRSACRLLKQAQVREVLGVPVGLATPGALGGCVFTINAGAGTVGVGVTSFAADAQAQAFVSEHSQAPDGCQCRILKIPGLGQNAIEFAGNTGGATVYAQFGLKVLTVAIAWSDTAENPGMAVTLARDAASHL
jgi:hypothetical protein